MGFDERTRSTEGLVERENLKRNGEGYSDPTAYRAIKNVDDANNANARFHKLLEIIFDACELAGFHLEGRITVRDRRTGKIWR